MTFDRWMELYYKTIGLPQCGINYVRERSPRFLGLELNPIEGFGDGFGLVVHEGHIDIGAYLYDMVIFAFHDVVVPIESQLFYIYPKGFKFYPGDDFIPMFRETIQAARRVDAVCRGNKPTQIILDELPDLEELSPLQALQIRRSELYKEIYQHENEIDKIKQQIDEINDKIDSHI